LEPLGENPEKSATAPTYRKIRTEAEKFHPDTPPETDFVKSGLMYEYPPNTSTRSADCASEKVVGSRTARTSNHRRIIHSVSDHHDG
jgi:hypothetical protein